MKVLETVALEVCLDGSVRKEFSLDEVVTRDVIGHLGAVGSLEYFPSCARPFFRVTRPGCYVLKGVEGNATFQVLFIIDSHQHEDDLTRHIEAYRRDEDGSVYAPAG